MEIGSKTPLILNLGNGQEWVVSFTPLPPHPRKQYPGSHSKEWFPFHSKATVNLLGKRKIFFPFRESNSSSYSAYRLSYDEFHYKWCHKLYWRHKFAGNSACYSTIVLLMWLETSSFTPTAIKIICKMLQNYWCYIHPEYLPLQFDFICLLLLLLLLLLIVI